MKTTTLFLLVLATGCKWTEFDDIEAESWVANVGKPSSDATDWGLALARGARAGATSGSFAAMGNAEVVYHDVAISPAGEVSPSDGQNLSDASSLPSLEPQPILISNPDSDEVSLVCEGLGNQTLVWQGSGATLNVITLNNVPTSKPDTATYVRLAGETDSQVLVATADTMIAAPRPLAPPNPAKCAVTDGASAMQVRALGVRRPTGQAHDDVVVWGSPAGAVAGRLAIYDSGFYATGCATPPTPIAIVDTTGFVPDRGSRIVRVDDTHVLLVGRSEPGDVASYLALWDVSGTPALVGTPVTVPDLRTAAILDRDGEMYVVAGYPNATVDNVTAGQVMVFALSLTSGVSTSPAMMLHDAQPENNQQYGRAVAVSRVNGQPVIAVGADNEVFVYFRTTLYGETRQQ